MMPPVIEKRRQKALQIFQSMKMPSPKMESWRYTELKADLDALNVGEQKISFPDFTEGLKQKGIIFTDIKTAIEQHFDILAEHLPMSILDFRDKLSAMHGAMWHDGVFLYVPPHIKIDMPLRSNLLFQSGAVLSHTLIVLEEGASATYIEDHQSQDIGFRNDAVEIILRPNAQLDFISLQRWEHDVTGIANWKARVLRDATMNWIFGQFGGSFSRVHVATEFAGQGAQATNKGVFFGDGDQHIDITTDAIHTVPHTTCDILVKGVLDQKATSVYRGMIKITKEAQHTNSYLSDHSMILSDAAVSNSIPSLEIDANEVRASHGATIGRPDEEEIFYLMARGLSRQEALRQILIGYFAQVTKNIDVDDVRETFNNLVREKIA